MTHSRALRRVRKQSQRQPGRLEQRDSRSIAKHPRSVPGIGIAHCPQFFVITTDERRAAANAATQDRAVHSWHSSIMAVVSFEIFSAEKSGRQRAECFCTAIRVSRVSAPQAGNVQQHEQQARRFHPQEFIEIAAHALPRVHRRNLGVAQRRRASRSLNADSATVSARIPARAASLPQT